MAETGKIGSREMSEDNSNDDTISITSTVLSDQGDEYLYPLECILAERDEGGVMKYLVKWEGYPEERNTWEAREMFQDEEATFKDWQEQKMRIDRGYAMPFDVAAFEDRCYEWQEAREKRKLHRRDKRISFGLPVAPLEAEPEENEESAVDDDDDDDLSERENSRSTKRRRKSRRSKDGDTDVSLESIESEDNAMDIDGPRKIPKPTMASSEWTSKQQSALMNGLEVLKGPKWAEILSLHWPTLKEFGASDLETQARIVKNEFKESGRQIPDYLRAVPDKPSSSTGPKFKKASEKRSRTQSREQSLTKKSNGGDTDSSVDSLMEDLRIKNKKLKQIDPTGKEKQAASAPRENAPSVKPTSAPKAIVVDIEAGEKPRSNEPLRTEKPKVSKTSARPRRPENALSLAHQSPKRVQSSQLSARARPFVIPRSRPGPARAPTIGRRPRKALPDKTPNTSKRPPVTGNVLSNWDKGKIHGNSSLAVKAKARDAEEKVYDKHSIRRRNQLKGRTEPMPDTSSLHFINLKDGKVVKNLVPRPSTGPTKSPYQMLQEQRLKESATTEPPVGDTSWMDEMDDEITVNTSQGAVDAPVQAPKAPQAMMMPVQGVQKRASIPLSAYTQRSQALAAIPQASLSTSSAANLPHSPPPPPPARSPLSTSVPSSKAIAPLPAPLQLKELEDHPHIDVQSPRTAPLPAPPQPNKIADASRLVSQSLQSAPTPAVFSRHAPQGASSPIKTQKPPVSQPPSSPRGLENIIADMRQAEEREKQSANSRRSGRPNEPVDAKLQFDVFGDLYAGQDSTQKIKVKFRGLEKFYRGLLISVMPPRSQGLRVTQLCTAADYEARFHSAGSDNHGSGFIIPSFYADLTAIDVLIETLKLHVSGGLVHLDKLTILFYPANAEDWYFLDQTLPPIPPEGTLRFLLRDSMRGIVETSKEDYPRRRKIERRMVKKGKEINIPGEPSINTVMRLLYEIDYPRLIQQLPPHKSSECAKFFLLFPKEARDEHDLVVKFLSANNALEIYTYNPDKMDAAWDYFYTKVEAGAMIAHSSFWQFHLIPNFGRFLRKSMNIWSISLRKDKKMIHPYLTRLFPHGCLLLFTDSLILLQPREAIRILGWFRLKILNDKPAGTWKIVTRPGLRDFCVNCCNERTDHEEGRRFVEIYQELVYMLDPDELYDFDEDKPKDEAPIHCMRKIKSFNTKVGRRVDNRNLDHAAIAKNDEVLVEFFAGYASCNMEHHRRFHIITGFEDDSLHGGKAKREQWVEKYTFLETFTPATFYSKTNVPTQDELKVLAARKHKEVIAQYDRGDAELDAASKRDDEEAVKKDRERMRDWERMCEENPKLRAVYEKVDREMEGQWSEGEKEEGEVDESEWDQWSNDSTSVGGEDVEMGEAGNAEGEEKRGMFTPGEVSEMTDSDETSSDEED